MSKTKPKLTVITPSYNSGKKLLDTYASIASQGVDYELLIMDGVSTDGSLESAKHLAENDNRIRVHSAKDNGVYDAMNKGIALATGDFIYFIGAGDIAHAGAIKQMAAYFPESLATFVYGDCMLDGEPYDGKFTSRKLLDRNICHQGIFYGRDVFRICGLFDSSYRLLADWDYNQRCFASRRIRKIYAPVLVATFEGGGISSRGDAPYLAERKRLMRKNMGYYMYKVWWEPRWWKIRACMGRIARRVIPRH